MRNPYPDLLKAVCLFLTVTIHAPFQGLLGVYANALSRAAVPVFLLLSGFYYDGAVSQKGRIPQIKKVAFLLLFSLILYFLFGLFPHLSNQTAEEWLSSILHPKRLFLFFLLDEPPYAVHLWYLHAFLCVLLIFAAFRGKRARTVLYCAAPALLLTQIVLTIVWNDAPSAFTRNFFLTALPYFSLGAWLSERKEALLSSPALKKRLLLPALFLFCLTAAGEISLYRAFGQNPVKEYYASTPLQAFTVVLLALKATPTQKKPLLLLAKIGGVCLTPVYILHPLFIDFTDWLANALRFSAVCVAVKPIFVFLVTLAFVVCGLTIKYFFKKFQKKEKPL